MPLPDRAPTSPTPEAGPRDGRLREALRFEFGDHALLRRAWSNFGAVAPGVWRSAQPSPADLARIKARGIGTILSLRRSADILPWQLEAEACDRLGLELHSVNMLSREAPSRDALRQLFDAFRRLDRPFLMHCKSGADRTSLASALYLIAHRGATVEEARTQMGLRWLHLKWTKTGVLDRVLDLYEDRLAQGGPIDVERWAAEEYDPARAALPSGAA